MYEAEEIVPPVPLSFSIVTLSSEITTGEDPNNEFSEFTLITAL